MDVDLTKRFHVTYCGATRDTADTADEANTKLQQFVEAGWPRRARMAGIFELDTWTSCWAVVDKDA